MAMTVASLAETLLPLAVNTAAAARPGTPTGEFAALLQSLFAGVFGGGQGTDSEGDPLALPAPPTEGEGDTPATANTSGAAAMLASLELLLSQFTKPESAVANEPAQADPAVTSIAPSDAGLELPSDAVLATVLEQAAPTETEPPSDGAPPVSADPPDAAPVVTSAPTVPVQPEVPKAPATPVIEGTAAMPDALTAADAASEQSPSAGSTNDPPPGAPAGTNSDSVVRFVGNADNPGSQPSSERGRGRSSDHLPHASVQGIAHAAEPSRVADLRADVPAVHDAQLPAAEPIELPPAVSQVGKAVLEQVERAGGEAVIRLDPPELGSVSIHVRLTGDAVHLHVEADQPATTTLLRDHTQDLSNLLGDRGLNLADVHVGNGGHGQSQRQDELPAWSRPRRDTGNEFASILGIEGPSAVQAHNRLRTAYNPDGRHIYRV